MSLIAVLSIEVGAAIAKSILRFWLKDFDPAGDTASTIIDILKSQTTDRIAQRHAQRQFEAIGEKVGESLLPLFEAQSDLDEGSRTAVARAVTETLNTISGVTLVQFNLDPARLAKHLVKKYPATRHYFGETETFLYQRTISESCAYIIDIASQLPTFRKDISVELLKRENHILAVADEIVQEVRRMRQQLNPEEKEAQNRAQFELEYRRAVLRNFDTLQLFGTDITASSRRHRLSIAYVMLSVEQQEWRSLHQSGSQGVGARGYGKLQDGTILRAFSLRSQQLDDETIPGEPDVEFQQKNLPGELFQMLGHQGEGLKSQVMIIQTTTRSVLSVNEALAHSRRLVIRGLAGSGKTTLLQWIAVTSASQGFTDSLASWNALLPFYIRLRSCVQSELPAPEAFPKFVALSIAGQAPPGWVHAKLASGCALLLIDGLDEIPAWQREDVRIWLKDLVQAYPTAHFILTSRPHALEQGWIDDEGFELAELQPMTVSDISIFIDHWHTAVAEEVTDAEERAELPSLAAHLKEEIQQSRAKRDLATNPLLCAMLCALHRERKRNLPSDRIELYEAFCQMLIERRDKERRILLTDYPAHVLTYRQKRVLLEDFAYWLMKNGWSEVDLSRADERFAKKLLCMHNISPDISGSDTRQFFLERTGMVCSVVVDRLSFTHRTFQEFLAAQAVVDEGDIGVLIKHAHHDQWWETIILACGLASKKVREELLLGLIDRGDAEKEHRYPLHMLAVACLETSIELEPVVKHDIQQCLSELVPPKNREEAIALARARELAVPYLTYNSQYLPSTLVACVFALAHIGGEAALRTLEEYIRNPLAEVIEALLNLRPFFDEKIYAQRILFSMLENRTPLSRNLSSLDGFQHLHVRHLDLDGCGHIQDISPLEDLTQLTSLSLADCTGVNAFASLAQLTQLTHLSLAGCWQIQDLAFLEHLPRLVYLDLSGCHRIWDFAPLSHLTRLRYLDLTRCAQVKDLTPLRGLIRLTQLSLANCWQIQDLTSLASLTSLHLLDLARCWQIQDLSPLSHLTNLTLLNLSYCDGIKDLNSLSNLRKIKQLHLYGTPLWTYLMRE